LGVSAFAVVVAFEFGCWVAFSRHHPHPSFAPTPPPPLAMWGSAVCFIVGGSQLVFGLPGKERRKPMRVMSRSSHAKQPNGRKACLQLGQVLEIAGDYDVSTLRSRGHHHGVR
jgi:hypothetical protein